jgi:hypothetical protein
MKTKVFVSMLLVVFGVYSDSYGDGNLTENFDDNTMGAVWGVADYAYNCEESSFTLSEINQRLEFSATLPPLQSEEDENSCVEFYYSNQWWLDVNQDFAFKIDYHTNPISEGDCAEVLLGIAPSTQDVETLYPYIYLSAGCCEGENYYWYEGEYNDWDEVLRSTDNGTLYVSYVAATDTLYLGYEGYGAVNAWITLPGILKGQWGGVPIYVGFGGAAYDGATVTAGQFYLDNFVLDSGVVTQTTAIPGDIAGLHGVNLADYGELAAHWDQTGCPTDCEDADINMDGTVDISDLVILAGNWLQGITVENIAEHMSKYETTNAEYCQFLNAALASGDIIVNGDGIFGANGSNSGADFVGEAYYYLAGLGGATNGGAARINYSGGSFTIDSGFENHPVTYVSWYGATAFCNYYGYRLPTEWEWQAVADYDGSYNYGCGTTINNSIANYTGSSHPYGTTVVGAFGSYGYGMCDMAGNVFEWTSSLFDPAYSFHILRGGSWCSVDDECLVSSRLNIRGYPYGTRNDIGFRVCR